MAKNYNDTQELLLHDETHHEDPGVLSPEATMVVLTWVTFFLLLFVLQKFALKPILTALQQREEGLKKSVEKAEQIEIQMQQLEQTKTEIIQKAEDLAQSIIKEARETAEQAARNIQNDAREEARIIMENAQRDLKDEFAKANAQLRQQSAEISVKLASKLIEENLDDAKNKKIIDNYMKEWV